jgi:hypothetical protein
MAAVAHDFDGEYFVVGQQGEVEEVLDHRRVYVPDTAARVFGLGTVVDLNNADALDAVNATINVNYWALLALPEGARPTVEEAIRIAFLRVHALTKGWGDMANDMARHNVRYNDITIIPVAQVFRVNINDALHDGDKTAAHNVPNWDTDAAWRTAVKRKVLNMVCLVAFFMRTRGHHWTADSDDRYQKIWRNCLYEEEHVGLNWEKVAHHTYHFIYPDILDGIWREAVTNARCAGALIKRFDSLPAGVAAVGAVQTGATDILIVLPNIRNLVPDAFQELERCANVIRGHRWAGSINRRFYDGTELIPDEKKLGSIAAVILGALQAVSSAAPLRNSKALQRVAQNAPITGTLINTMIQKAVTDDRMVNGLFVDYDSDE